MAVIHSPDRWTSAFSKSTRDILDKRVLADPLGWTVLAPAYHDVPSCLAGARTCMRSAVELKRQDTGEKAQTSCDDLKNSPVKRANVATQKFGVSRLGSRPLTTLLQPFSADQSSPQVGHPRSPQLALIAAIPHCWQHWKMRYGCLIGLLLSDCVFRDREQCGEAFCIPRQLS